MKDMSLSRRKFLQGSAGVAALAAGGIPFGAQQAFAADLSSQELRTVGLSVTVQDRMCIEVIGDAEEDA